MPCHVCAAQLTLSMSQKMVTLPARAPSGAGHFCSLLFDFQSTIFSGPNVLSGQFCLSRMKGRLGGGGGGGPGGGGGGDPGEGGNGMSWPPFRPLPRPRPRPLQGALSTCPGAMSPGAARH